MYELLSNSICDDRKVSALGDDEWVVLSETYSVRVCGAFCGLAITLELLKGTILIISSSSQNLSRDLQYLMSV